MNLFVREIIDSDFEAWLPLWEGYQRFYEIEIPLEESRITWARFLDPREPMRAALAFDGERAVGMVTLIFHRSTWSVHDYAYLEDLYTDPEQRARGVGRALIAWVEQRARAQQCSRLYWHTQQTNLRAQALYEQVAQQAGTFQYRKALSH